MASSCRTLQICTGQKKRVQNNFLVRYTSSLRCVFTKSWSDPMPPNSTHAGLQTVFKLDPQLTIVENTDDRGDDEPQEVGGENVNI